MSCESQKAEAADASAGGQEVEPEAGRSDLKQQSAPYNHNILIFSYKFVGLNKCEFQMHCLPG